MPQMNNFANYEQQYIAAGSASSFTSFTKLAAQQAQDCYVAVGANAVQLVFSSSASPTAVWGSGANGTTQVYLPNGFTGVIQKGANNLYVAAITGASVTDVYLHAGQGN